MQKRLCISQLNRLCESAQRFTFSNISPFSNISHKEWPIISSNINPSVRELPSTVSKKDSTWSLTTESWAESGTTNNFRKNPSQTQASELSTSKTGKHGGCKVSIMCKCALTGKNIVAVRSSQDSLDVIQPVMLLDHTLVDVPDREGTAVFIREGEEVVVEPTKDELAALQAALENDEDPQCSILEWNGSYKLMRIARRKK